MEYIYDKSNKIYNNTDIKYLVNHTYYIVVIYSFHLVFYADISV